MIWRIAKALPAAALQLVRGLIDVYVHGRCAEPGCSRPHAADRAWCHFHNVKNEAHA